MFQSFQKQNGDVEREGEWQRGKGKEGGVGEQEKTGRERKGKRKDKRLQ